MTVPDELSPDERRRYEWQLSVPDFGEESQRRLKKARVLISRIGGVGGSAALQLAAAGVGRLIVAHAGNLRLDDLNRQTLMTTDWLGKPRVESAARRLGELNPLVAIETVSDNVTDANAADLVSRAVVPGRFIEVAPEVVMNVLGRSENGLLESFFADDRRDPEVRRTYSADSAVLARDEQGYILRLEDGRMQFAEAEGGFSEIAFDRYDLVLDTLTGRADDAAPATSLTQLRRRP